jgi:hypothetical protein
MKNFIIGYGEALTTDVSIKSGSGDKKHPYSFVEARNRFVGNLKDVIHEIDSKPKDQCANGEFVIKFIQHPSYLAKSYYPNKLFKKFGVKDVGSKAIKIKPLKWAIKKPPEDGLASCIFVAGKRSQFEAMLNSVEHDDLPETSKKLIRTFEKISIIKASEKVKNIVHNCNNLKLEVVLHAAKKDKFVRDSFTNYTEHLGGKVDWERAKTVGGLTFLPVSISDGCELELAEFSHLRAVRSIPKLRFNTPDVVRTTMSQAFTLPAFAKVENNFKVCIFDGGLGDNTIISQWANEIVPADVTSAHPSLLAHGSEVCSSYLFGPMDSDTMSFNSPYTNVDIVRVLSPDDSDPDLFDVLGRIESVLKEKKYKYVNISLGPRLAIDDDDVHVWTSVIDALLQDGHCLATIAIGNDGELDGEYSRIQPPSDMVNCFAIGASNSNENQWDKASYSCIGPGRSPGVVKPDGLMFGGSEGNLFKVYSPLTHSIVGTMGTSYAAPYALRVAAGIDAITQFDLAPSTVKALLVHHADRKNKNMVDVGWGRLPNSPEEVIECLDDEAIIVYQGQLKQSQHLRVPIPIPEGIDCTWVHLKATFCFNAITDPEHPLHYTRSGLDITFRANDEKVKKGAEHANTKSFFSVGNLYETEEELRADAHKWETCISREQRFKKTTLLNPVFDVKYHAREKGGDAQGDPEPLNYSLIVSIQAEGDTNIYDLVLQQNQVLQSVKVSNRIKI